MNYELETKINQSHEVSLLKNLTKFDFVRLAVVLFFILYSLFLIPVQAAELFFQDSGGGKIDLVLNTEEQKINGLEGEIILSSNLELKDILDSDSIVTLWIAKGMKFAGAIPGGYVGEGKIFSLVVNYRPSQGRRPCEGQEFDEPCGDNAFVKVKNARVLLHDGKGTEAKLRISSHGLNCGSSQGRRPCEDGVEVDESLHPAYGAETADKDFLPPQEFMPKIARDPSIFNNQWFVVFAAQDKESGVDQFQIKETRLPISFLPFGGKWQEAKSPHLLQDQQLISYIYVGAIDKAGNKRVAILSPQNFVFYANPWVWSIIIISVLAVIIWLIL